MNTSHHPIHFFMNQLAIFCISIVLLFAFYFQLHYQEPPCPLCILQRLCFVATGLAFCLNLRFGIKVSHYGLALLAASLGLGVALRQTLIHIKPGDIGFGTPFLNIHLYSWCAILFSLIIILSSVGLLFDKMAFTHTANKSHLAKGIILLFVSIIFINAVSAFLECGFKTCPSNPTSYLMIS